MCTPFVAMLVVYIGERIDGRRRFNQRSSTTCIRQCGVNRCEEIIGGCREEIDGNK